MSLHNIYGCCSSFVLCLLPKTCGHFSDTFLKGIITICIFQQQENGRDQLQNTHKWHQGPSFLIQPAEDAPGPRAKALPEAAFQTNGCSAHPETKPLCWNRALMFQGAVLNSEQHFTEDSLSDCKLSFLSEGSRRGGGVLKAAQISLFYDIPAWEFLKVRDLRLSLIFKAKPTRNGCLLDCLHTHLQQDWQRFFYDERISTCFRNFVDLHFQ